MNVIIINVESVPQNFDFKNPSKKHLDKYGEKKSLKEFQEMFNNGEVNETYSNIYFDYDN